MIEYDFLLLLFFPPRIWRIHHRVTSKQTTFDFSEILQETETSKMFYFSQMLKKKKDVVIVSYFSRVKEKKKETPLTNPSRRRQLTRR